MKLEEELRRYQHRRTSGEHVGLQGHSSHEACVAIKALCCETTDALCARHLNESV